MNDYASQIHSEQSHVDRIYHRLDQLSAQTRERLAAVRAQGGKGSPTHQAERDSFNAMYEDRLAQLRAVDDRLVFGRLTADDGTTRYIGRIGMSTADHEPILTDWRAQAARPFYEATAKNRMGIILRRHIQLSFRKVVGIEDEVLNVTSQEAAHASQSGTLTGEGALLTSLAERRTGKMTDIVATIQAEQDRIIRQPLNRVVVVQGGPGTGKTAVALHRAAYLLYTNRRRLSHSGVLVIGPSTEFLHYIEQVLPSLGETGVLSRTIGTLLPGISAPARDDPFAASIKGDIRMATMIKNAINDRIRVPHHLPTVLIRGVRVRVTQEDILSAQAAARRTHLPHNRARVTFIDRMLDTLTARYATAAHENLTAQQADDVRSLLRMDQTIQHALNLAWLPLTAQWLLRNLWSHPRRLRRAAPWLSEAEIAALYRPENSPWTISDVPLLDEAMELIGPDPNKAAGIGVRKGPSEEEKFAQETLEQLRLAHSGLVNAKDLAAQMTGAGDAESIAAHASQDRAWTFGHIVVDEAQELTRMDWRMLVRRCPSRSFTIVGDVAQTAALGGTRQWHQTMDAVFGKGAWNLNKLTIDYRNPQEVSQLADAYATSQGLAVSTVHAVRHMPHSVLRTLVSSDEDLIPAAVQQTVKLAQTYINKDGTGRVAVVADPEVLMGMKKPLWEAIGTALGPDEKERLQKQDAWDNQIDLIDTMEIKGLEYDAVVIIQPGQIEENGPSRLSAASSLYVALTRPTQQLVLVRTRKDAEEIPL